MGVTMREQTTMHPECPGPELVPNCLTCRTRFLAVCSAFEETELVAFDRIVQHRCQPAKAVLFEEGSPADFVYSLSEGSVRLYRLLPDGRRQIVGFALPGDFLGVDLPDTHPYSAETIDPVRVCRMPRGPFKEMVDEKPHLLRKLHEVAARELHSAHDQMVVLGRRSAEARVAHFLLDLQHRWSRISKVSVTVPLPMNRTDIADYLGLTIETVSRTISKFGRDRLLLVVPDGVRLLDADGLAAIAQH